MRTEWKYWLFAPSLASVTHASSLYWAGGKRRAELGLFKELAEGLGGDVSTVRQRGGRREWGA